MKADQIIGDDLDRLVAKCLGATGEWRSGGPFFWDGVPCIRVNGHDVNFSPSTNWAQAGPIIEREKLQISPHFLSAGYAHPQGLWEWKAYVLGPNNVDGNFEQHGPTPLIAAMRCYCCSKLGDEIDIPEELCQQQNS